MNLDTGLTPFTKISSKWIPDLNVKCKTIKLLEDNIGENLDDLGYGNDFLDATPKVGFMKERVDKLDLIKIENVCSAEDNVKRMRRPATDWEKIFAKDTSDRVLLIQNIQRTLKPQQYVNKQKLLQRS